MTKNQKLKKIQELQNRLDDLEAKDPVGSVERLLEEEQAKAREAAGTPNGSALKVLARGLATVQGDERPAKMMRDLETAKEEARAGMDELSTTFKEQMDSLLEEVRTVEKSGKQLTEVNVQDTLARLAEYEGTFSTGMKELATKDSTLEGEVVQLAGELGVLYEKFNALPDHAPFLEETTTSVSRVTESTTDLAKALEELDKRLTNRVNNIQRGGGNANRSIIVGGNADTLGYFTDINLKAGTGITITYQANQTTKYTDITIASNGGGSGITRSIQTVAVNTVAAAVASTDYVYLASGNVTITLPTSVGNSNLYTIKNIGAGTVTIDTTGGETIDGDLTLILPLQFTSVDLISNNSGNWDIT